MRVAKLFFKLLALWLTVACVSVASAKAADATVAQNGDGQFKSIQDAINAAPQRTSRSRPWVIAIKPGVYRELIYVQREKRFITLLGVLST
jgi:pectinesterase